jgi:hypothetical protein
VAIVIDRVEGKMEELFYIQVHLYSKAPS